MARVITDTCIKDELCAEACPLGCIHPTRDEPGFAEARQLYVDPEACVDCGVCTVVCPTNSVFDLQDVPPKLARAAKRNAARYR